MENETEKIARLLKSSTPEESALIIKAMLDKQREQLVSEPCANRARIGYYTASSARQVQIYVDQMIETNKDVEFFYEDFPHQSPHTVRAKIDGGVRYLVETDETGKYVAWRKAVKIKKFPTCYGMYWVRSKEDRFPISLDGTLIGRIRDYDGPSNDSPITNTPSTYTSYMEQLTNFIENATNGQHQVIKNLKLTANDTKRIYTLFEPIKDEFELRVTPDRIIIHKGKLKTNEDTDTV